MRFIFVPGATVMLRLPNEKKLPLMTALFLLPLGILYYDVGSGASTATNLWVIGAVVMALYSMGSFYVQADMGWRILLASMARISEGDLTTRIDAKLGGHFGEVIRMLTQINKSLGDIVKQVRMSSRTAAASAREIAQGNANLSQRTERQAATLEETAAAMEEFSTSVKHNAENCTLASERARDADAKARDGARIVHGLVEAMLEIEQSSRRIAEIVGVIDGIAFQTNLLALNAAVEAARAGEQGRGFAVVATEVRNLAQRSAEAAKEVRELIERSVAQVKDGSRQAQEAGHAIDAIVDGVKQGNELVEEIANASRHQSSGIQEINRALVQLEEVTQQNAAMVEQAAAKSVAFGVEADLLMTIAERFKIAAELDESSMPHVEANAAAPQLRIAHRTVANSVRGRLKR